MTTPRPRRLVLAALTALTLIAGAVGPVAADDRDIAVTGFQGSGPYEYDYRAYNGQLVYYIVNIWNRGGEAATGVMVSQVLPDELAYLADPTDDRCSAEGSLVTCELGTMANLETVTVLIYTRATSAGTFTSTVTASSDLADAAPADNVASTDVTVLPSADLSVAITESADPVQSGKTVTYNTVATNTGPDPATGSRMNVNWQSYGPAATLLGFESSSNADCTHTFSNHIDCRVPILATGESLMLSVTLRYRGTGQVELRTYVVSAEFDPVADNESVESTTIQRKPTK